MAADVLKTDRQYRLICREGIWTLLHEGKEYAHLLDAKSRADAEQQIAEMLFVSRQRLDEILEVEDYLRLQHRPPA